MNSGSEHILCVQVHSQFLATYFRLFVFLHFHVELRAYQGWRMCEWSSDDKLNEHFMADVAGNAFASTCVAAVLASIILCVFK